MWTRLLYVAHIYKLLQSNVAVSKVILFRTNFPEKKLNVLLSHHFCVLSFHFALIRGLTVQSGCSRCLALAAEKIIVVCYSGGLMTENRNSGGFLIV